MSETSTPAPARATASPPRRRPTVAMLKGHDRRVRTGYPWAYANEVQMETHLRGLAPGTVVRLTDPGGEPLGTAAFNPHALICARILDPDPAASVDAAFFAARLKRSLALRERLFDRPYYRLVHGEADGLPGLIVDRFQDLLVLQCNAAWIEPVMEPLLAALEEGLAPSAVVLRNDSAARAQEGLESSITVVKGRVDGPVAVEENGATFFADPVDGQKTGWFFDQRPNRALMASLARKGARVLDLYAYAGGFGVLAAKAGASAVTMVDRSAGALDLARESAKANALLERCAFVRADVFEELERLGSAGERFDIVIGDPPAFVKSRKDLSAGIKGYRKLTRLAAAVTNAGGCMMIASCSHNVDGPNLLEQVSRGLRDAGRGGRVIHSGGAGMDHPLHPQLPETGYLKALVLELD